MFLDLDVVEFQDADVPFTNIILNSAMVRQVQRIDSNIQSRYLEGRERAIVDKEDDPNITVPTVEELPSQGAVIMMLSPQLGSYYTVTPYEEVKRQLMNVGRPLENKAAE